MTPISILMSNVHEMDLHYVWLKVWSGPADVPLQCLRRVACVTNSHLKHIFITGPESVGSAAFIFALWLAGWVQAVLLRWGDGCHMWRLAFFRCHSSFSDAGVLIWRRSVSATDSWPNQRFNLFSWDCWASHGCLVWFWMVETLIQSRICDFSPFGALSQWISLCWLDCRAFTIHAH